VTAGYMITDWWKVCW